MPYSCSSSSLLSPCAIRRFFPSSPEQPGQSWWAAAASALGCPWFCWQEYKIEMPHRSTTRKNHKEYKWLTERSLFSQREDRAGDEARVCQEIFLTFPQCSCSSSLNSLLEFAQGQEKSDLGIFSQTVHIFSSKEEQAENSTPMVPLGNLEVAQIKLNSASRWGEGSRKISTITSLHNWWTYLIHKEVFTEIGLDSEKKILMGTFSVGIFKILNCILIFQKAQQHQCLLTVM